MRRGDTNLLCDRGDLKADALVGFEAGNRKVGVMGLTLPIPVGATTRTSAPAKTELQQMPVGS